MDTILGNKAQLLIRDDDASLGFTRRVFFTFSIPASTPTVTEAILWLRGAHEQTGGTGMPIAAVPCTRGDWAENALTFNNAPLLAGCDFARITSGTPVSPTTVVNAGVDAWYAWNVTAIVNAQKAAGVISIGLAGANNQTYRSHFDSREAATAANRPRLEIRTGSSVASQNWPMFGRDYNNSRVSGSQWINSSNMASLQVVNRFAGNGVSGTPVVVDNVTYCADSSSRLYARNFETGVLLWSVQLNLGGITLTPYVSGDTVYITGEGSRVFAVNRATGVNNGSTTED